MAYDADSKNLSSHSCHCVKGYFVCRKNSSGVCLICLHMGYVTYWINSSKAVVGGDLQMKVNRCIYNYTGKKIFINLIDVIWQK